MAGKWSNRVERYMKQNGDPHDKLADAMDGLTFLMVLDIIAKVVLCILLLVVAFQIRNLNNEAYYGRASINRLEQRIPRSFQWLSEEDQMGTPGAGSTTSGQ